MLIALRVCDGAGGRDVLMVMVMVLLMLVMVVEIWWLQPAAVSWKEEEAASED